jgi:GNAT superfamily N-acetyltransferase
VTSLIRRAEPGDAVQLFKLVRDHAEFEQSDASVTLACLVQLLSGPSRVDLTVAEEHDLIVGYTAVTFDYSLWRGCLWAHLDCLFVRPAHRNLGTGKRLLDQALAQALAAGADRLEWQTPLWNEAAIRFYQREGAVCQVKKRFHLGVRVDGDDTAVMPVGDKVGQGRAGEASTV